MVTGPAPDGPVAGAGLLGEFDGTRAGRVAVVVGPGGFSRRLASTVRRWTGVDLDTWDRSDPEPAGSSGPLLLRSVEAGPDEAAELGARVGRLASAGEPVDCLVGRCSPEQTQRLATGTVVASQRTRAVERPATVRLWCATQSQLPAATAGLELGARVLLARWLANTPSNVKSPAWLAEQAAAALSGLARVRVRDASWLARQGFGGLLAVGGGSTRPPNLTHIEYRGAGGPHVVLVGKGITFDSGGLSLKPAPSMPLMKTDMSGAAAVVGAVAAAADQRLPVRVTGLLACAENLPSGTAMRPGDVIRHHGGRTTEVMNTDAEGRLVLADCLAYAVRQLAPDHVVDVATLTGAATVGLGRQHTALFTPDDRLAAALVAAGRGSGDRVWRLPLADDYRPAISSSIADAANAATDATVQGGAITAALFLQPFARSASWAHLDIAGAGRTETDRPDCRKGATGFGVSLLARFLADPPAAR